MAEKQSNLPAPDGAQPRVTRIEVIDHRPEARPFGRAYVAYGASVLLAYQDDGRTLKVFVDGPAAAPESDTPRRGKPLGILDDPEAVENEGASAALTEAYAVIDELAPDWSGSSIATVLRAFLPEPTPPRCICGHSAVQHHFTDPGPCVHCSCAQFIEARPSPDEQPEGLDAGEEE